MNLLMSLICQDLKRAIIEERKYAQEQMSRQEAQQKEVQDMHVAKETTELQIKAEQQATKQSEVQLHGLEVMQKQKLDASQPERDAQMNDSKISIQEQAANSKLVQQQRLHEQKMRQLEEAHKQKMKMMEKDKKDKKDGK
jgi:hypothetical protein